MPPKFKLPGTKQDICPNCDSQDVRLIFYGEVGSFYRTEDFDEFNKKYFTAISPNGKENPKYHCDSCGTNFGIARMK